MQADDRNAASILLSVPVVMGVVMGVVMDGLQEAFPQISFSCVGRGGRFQTSITLRLRPSHA